MPLWPNSWYVFLLHLCTQQVFPRYLGKFQSVMNIRTHIFWTIICKNLWTPLIVLVPSNGYNYYYWLLLIRERAFGNPSAIEDQTAKMNSGTGLWARCPTSLLLDSGRSLKSLLAEMKCRIRLATKYFFHKYLSHLLYRKFCINFNNFFQWLVGPVWELKAQPVSSKISCH